MTEEQKREKANKAHKILSCSGTLEYLSADHPVHFLGDEELISSVKFDKDSSEIPEDEKVNLIADLDVVKSNETLVIVGYYDSPNDKMSALTRILDLRRYLMSKGYSKNNLEEEITRIKPEFLEALNNTIGVYKVDCKK